MAENNTVLKRILSNRPVQHLAFWVLSFYVLLRIFSTDSEIRNIDYIYDGLFHFTLIMPVYLNLLVLIPNLLDKGRYFFYIALVGLSTLVFSQLNIWFFDYLVDFLLPGYYFISYYELVDIIQFFAVYMGASTLLKLSKGWFQLAEARTKLAETRQEKLNAELEALKSQVNPHFLFNSLNNLYGLSLKGDKKTPASILKLSEVLRYMIYEAKDEKVPLEKEIAFIENYINLQRLRSDHHASISFEVAGEARELQIAPLLFIPFVENSFKHGVKGETGDSYVDVKMEVGDDFVNFTCRNNMGSIDDVEQRKYGGIGLENVKKRLKLIYEDRYTLELNEGKEEYKVNLTIELR
ncbi:histidine kinase [Imperialibacter roseus]|uniref:Histidine kinase n=1 Tax=Imperialibacter roseus TaxID=1324217 RepID=A0ABZ0IKG2_9BACT|nr:histidine kinase [Imperialibacter roseus]WOK04266.1 histidine kinase [Imperialibacter roseus]|tara:strand:- start:31883 stop:32935 length:1053 start_codon:yes stop_codon:yes gene_type:complete